MKPSLSPPPHGVQAASAVHSQHEHGPRARRLLAWLGLALVSGCAALAAPDHPAANLQAANRLTWGASVPGVQALSRRPTQAWLDAQLRASSAPPDLPAPVQAQINAMTISQRPVTELVVDMAEQRQAANGLTDDAAKQAARSAWQQEMNRLAREAAQRHLCARCIRRARCRSR